MKKIIVILRYWIYRLIPSLLFLKIALIKFAKNHIPMFYPQVFHVLKNIKSISNKINNKKKTKANVLFYSLRQDQLHVVWNFIIAHALRIRGHKIKIIQCDGLIRKACNETWYPKLPAYLCRQCFKFAKKTYDFSELDIEMPGNYSLIKNNNEWLGKLNTLDYYKAQEVIEQLDFRNYRSFIYKDFLIHDIIKVSVHHFLRVENIEVELEKNHNSRKIYKEFMIGAVLMINICDRILKLEKPDVIVMLNGKFMAERVMFEMAKRAKIRTVVYESGLMPDTMVFLHNEVINYKNVGDWNHHKTTPLDKNQETQLDGYLQDRINGIGQTQEYWDKLEDGKNLVSEIFQLKTYKSSAVLFPNVVWDSALAGLNIYFDSTKDWLESTISFFSSHKDIVLIIRIHPAEIHWPGTFRDSMYSWIKTKYGRKLPNNIKIIKPENNISSYTLMKLCDLGIVASSTTGLEMALLRKPVIVNEKVHYWNKGFTIDPSDEFEYHDILFNHLIKKQKPNLDYEMARRYAYYIFFKYSLGLKSINSENYRVNPPKLEISNFDQLLPGIDPNLDKICDGIVRGTPFI